MINKLFVTKDGTVVKPFYLLWVKIIFRNRRSIKMILNSFSAYFVIFAYPFDILGSDLPWLNKIEEYRCISPEYGIGRLNIDIVTCVQYIHKIANNPEIEIY